VSAAQIGIDIPADGGVLNMFFVDLRGDPTGIDSSDDLMLLEGRIDFELIRSIRNDQHDLPDDFVGNLRALH